MERFLNYRLTIETIGPLFIGSEENKNIAKSEYAIDELPQIEQTVQKEPT